MSLCFSCTIYEPIDENGELLNRVIHSMQKVDDNRSLLDCLIGTSMEMWLVDYARMDTIQTYMDDIVFGEYGCFYDGMHIIRK